MENNPIDLKSQMAMTMTTSNLILTLTVTTLTLTQQILTLSLTLIVYQGGKSAANTMWYEAKVAQTSSHVLSFRARVGVMV